MMRKLPFSLLVMSTVVLLASCSTVVDQYKLTKLFSVSYSTKQIQTMSANKLYAIDDPDLCAAYFANRPPNVKAEITRRDLITDAQWHTVNTAQVQKGMNLCEVLAAKGKPKSLDMGSLYLDLNYGNQTVQLVKQSGRYHVSMVQ